MREPFAPATIADLDLTAYIRPGDTIAWGQACAEPRSLTESLIRIRHALNGVRCFLGIPVGDTVRPEHADALGFFSYCATGANRALDAAGALEILPVHYSSLPALLSSGGRHVDVAFVLLSPPDRQGRYSFGLGADLMPEIVRSARVVIAEVSDSVPWTHGSRWLTDADLDVVLHTDRAPLEYVAAPLGAQSDAVAARVASLVPDGATLQVGLGAIPEAVLRGLADRRDLGIHSGLMNDPMMRLMADGAVTNAAKTIDRGLAVAGLLVGTRALFDFAGSDERVRVAPTSHTHDLDVLAGQDGLVAINSAIEVDLSGQVNSEAIGGRYVGAVGGAADFLRGAARSDGGLPIVALPSTAGRSSRVVAALSGPATLSRADAGIVVTEYGVADLRGRSLAERRSLLLEIAHPDHRDALDASAPGALVMEGTPTWN